MSPAEGRRFGLLVGGAFLVLGAVSRWRGHDIAPQVFWAAGGTLAAAGLLIPGYLGPVHRWWMRVGVALSKVTTPIFMGLIYFGVFTPIGFIRRVFGHSDLVRAPGNSFWISREAGAGRRSDLQRHF